MKIKSKDKSIIDKALVDVYSLSDNDETETFISNTLDLLAKSFLQFVGQSNILPLINQDNDYSRQLSQYVYKQYINKYSKFIRHLSGVIKTTQMELITKKIMVPTQSCPTGDNHYVH